MCTSNTKQIQIKCLIHNNTYIKSGAEILRNLTRFQNLQQFNYIKVTYNHQTIKRTVCYANKELIKRG
jgi:hypothetical protein